MPALLAITVLAFASAPVAHAQPDITIPTVLIDKPNNPADTTGYGAVGYNYYIGTSFVTNAQYAIFLNAVAKAGDPYGLYNESMGSQVYGGINRTSDSGSYLYTVKEGWANKPVNYVSFLDAARFCNWLTNGAGESSDTETGMYKLSDGGIGMTRNADAWAAGGYAITSENEWYKAAYYNLSTATYTLFATGNEISTSQANFFNSVGNVTDAGAYRAEQNGTLDMMGNVYEWNEGIAGETSRSTRGGSFGSSDGNLVCFVRYSGDPNHEANTVGFRVSSLGAVPESSTYGILGGAAALLGAVALRRRRRG